MPKTISQKRAPIGKIDDTGVIRAIQQIYTDLNELIESVNSSNIDIEDDSEKAGTAGNVRVARRPHIDVSGKPTQKYVIEGRTNEGWVTTNPLEFINFKEGAPTIGEVVTISSGAITAKNTFHKVATESAASSDTLTTINGGTIGQTLVLSASDDGDSVVVDDSAGNIETAGNFTLDNLEDTISLIYNGTAWVELSRSNNGA